MSILHVFSVAEGRVSWATRGSGCYPWDPGKSQFRSHHAIPWDEAQSLYLEPDTFRALVTLARQSTPDRHMKGRIFDVLRALDADRGAAFSTRDYGPCATITPSNIFTRIELENLVSTWTPHQWLASEGLAALLLGLPAGMNWRGK